MLMEQARKDIVNFGNRMIADRLTIGTAGNISVFDREAKTMAISPSGIPYAKVTPEDVVVMDLDGNILESDRKPSSEHGLHAAFYRSREDACAVVHAHSMFCTTIACLGQTLKPIHYAIAEGGAAELPLVPYETYGTPELAAAVEKTLKQHTEGRGVLLANHGMVSYGPDLKSAYGFALTMEWSAEVQWRCLSAGGGNYLTAEQMGEVIEHLKTYGQADPSDKGPRGYNQ